MEKQLFLLSSLCLLLSACENHNTSTPSADNTARNVRDREAQTMTSGDQTENETDRKFTQSIRQALMSDNSLSTNGKNVKIITVNGVVTLRGPVNSENEKIEIAKKARSVAGVRNVENKLEVIPNDNNPGSR